MPKILMKPLTETSWILTSDGERIGLVSQSQDGFSVIGKTLTGTFSSLSDLSKKLGSTIAIEQPPEPAQEKEAGAVNGYPIKHSEWYNVLDEPVPSYTRLEKGQTRYAAGYYGLKFSNGWTHSFCPKLATLSEYEYIGPFTTKLEMQHQISSKNKTVNV